MVSLPGSCHCEPPVEKLINKNISYPQYFYDNLAAFTDNDIYNGLLINKQQLLNYIFEPNKVKFPFYRLKLENFFNEK